MHHMSVGEITLRPATIDDAPAVAELFTHTRDACMSHLPKLHTADEDRAWMRNVVFEHCDVWVAEVDGRLAGFVALEGDLLEHLYVRPDLHRRGIGSTLLAKARELRPGGFRLWVFQQNAQARRFYESHGLVVLRLTDGAGNEERTPDAEYAWRPII
jgi:ribosomal protein S18 acetylase RimI-like enzyme